MQKAVTSDPFLWQRSVNRPWNKRDEPRASFLVISVGEVLSPLGISHIPPSLASESCNEIKAQGGKGHGQRDQNQKKKKEKTKTSRHRCLPCPPHGLFSMFV